MNTSLDYFSDTPIADSIRQEFLDNLLNIYEELETSFSRQLYLFYKGFEFRSLWNMDEKMQGFNVAQQPLQKAPDIFKELTHWLVLYWK